MTDERGASRVRYLFPPEAQPRPDFEPLPTVEGGWAMVAADPAWKFKQWKAPETDEQKRVSRAAERHYATMSLDDIMALPVRDVVARNCHCFLWITGPFLMDGRAVLESWGFTYSTDAFVWVKLNRGLDGNQGQLLTLDEVATLLAMGTGKTTRKNAEFCLLGRRGSPKRLASNIREIIIEPVREHSRKPEQFYDRVERYCPGPRLELFSRRQRPGWTAWGNETGKFR